MPCPRKPHRKGASRSARRRRHEQAWLTRKLQERFLRFAEILAEKKREEENDDRPPYVKEKVPGLATEDSSDAVIPGEDPGPPETLARTAVPDRRAARLSGMTVLTD